MHVYYDPPTTNHVVASTPAGPLSMIFAGRASGAAARILLDSGATHNFISECWVKSAGAHTAEAGGAATVTLADGGAHTSSKTCKLQLTLQGFTHDVTCHVMPLASAFDIILGEAWLTLYGARLDFARRVCFLHRPNRRELVLQPTNPGQKEPASAAMLLSATQLKRLTRKEVVHCCLVRVTEVPDQQVDAALRDPRI